MLFELSELEQWCEQREWELEYDDGPSTFRYSCMSSGSFSNSNHSIDALSLKQPPLANINIKRKVAQNDFNRPAGRKCHKRMIRGTLFPSTDCASSLINSCLFLVESKTCHCRIMLNVLVYCSTIIGIYMNI